MRLRHSNKPQGSSNRRVSDLINDNDALSTSEQEEVLKYFADSLRCSVQFLKIVVCLHAVFVIVYFGLLISGSPLLDVGSSGSSLDQLQELATPTSATTTRKGMAPHQRRGSSSNDVSLGAAVAMVLSALLFLLAGVSGYQACRRLRVNVDELQNEPTQDYGHHPLRSADGRHGGARNATSSIHPTDVASAGLSSWKVKLRQSPPFTLRVIAIISCLPSFYWLVRFFLHRRATTRVYAEFGLEQPSFLRLRPLGELLLAIWQPLFHFAIAALVQSMLGTREKLIELSRLKYRFEKF